ncbi:MAG: hypothetical protein BroJett011_33910 [Chloroflexota bacterium]|nr:MAG: hypothetical protein BroJett011_33910 [Chloroflexota bacterium]
MSRKDDLQNELILWQRRLQKLKEQQARKGIDTEPHILLEIEDIEASIEKLQAELAELNQGQNEAPQPKLAVSPAVSVPVTPTVAADPKLVSFRSQPRIFLCHASEDKPRVKELYYHLKDAGYHPWLDKFDLLPGQTWRREIEKIIRDPYNLVLVCLSNNSITKRGVVQQEIKWALDILEQTPVGTIYLIPVRLEECQVPERLSELHWVNLFEPDGFKDLTRALDYEIGKRQPPAEIAPAKQPKPKLPEEPATPAKLESPRQTKKKETFEPELILIPAGEFQMGSNPEKDKQADSEEQPQHKLCLPDYYIAKTPVTNVQYSAFVQATKRKAPYHWEKGKIPEGKENHPVVHVSWDDAVAYCSWLAQVTGKAYRLPSEAEWEKAARGTDGRIYPWGNKWDAKRCNTQESKLGGTTPVEIYSASVSPYGVLDMAGNVWEWTNSLPYSYPYDPKDGRESPGAKGHRVLRGGSWDYRQRSARCACRRKDHYNRCNGLSGFRVAVSSIFYRS